MPNPKNILVGFLVSFIGSIPLGYLNVIGFNIFKFSGINATIHYLLGVIVIEFFVIFGTLLFAKKLNQNPRLLQFIDAFSIIFMFILAYIFFSNSNSSESNKDIFVNFNDNFFYTGLIFSALNFIQIPFWLSWNLYLLNKKHIQNSKIGNWFYVTGTLLGTFMGMLVLILSLNYLSNQVDFLSKYLISIIIPIVFVGLGILQSVKYYKKYYK
jgi:threonine/homoserine/homoserine lactone efflux protein